METPSTNLAFPSIIVRKGKQKLDKNYQKPMLRSSHCRCSVKKAILKNFAKFTEKHLRQGLFFNKVAEHMWTTFLQNTSGRLLLKVKLDSSCFEDTVNPRFEKSCQ